LKPIIRYLAGTQNYVIVFSPKEEGGVTGFTDADLSGDLHDSNSTSVCVFLCHGGATSYFNPRQECISSISMTEAEFVAESESAKEATFIRAVRQIFISKNSLEKICST
jgi:hypothetical protein